MDYQAYAVERLQLLAISELTSKCRIADNSPAATKLGTTVPTCSLISTRFWNTGVML